MKRILAKGEAGSSERWLNLQKIAEEESAVQTVSEVVAESATPEMEDTSPPITGSCGDGSGPDTYAIIS
jgi:hypothetical protein